MQALKGKNLSLDGREAALYPLSLINAT